MSNKLTPFEDKVREAIEHYEMPYDSGSWNEMNNRLNSGVASNTWVVALFAAVFFTAIGSWTLYKYSFNYVGATGANRIARFESIKHVKNSAIVQFHSESIEATEIEENTSTLAQNISVETTQGTIGLTSSDQNIAQTNQASGDSNRETTIAQETSSTSTATANTKLATNTSLTVIASSTTMCSGGEIEFDAVNGPKEGSYLWNFGDGNFSNKPNPKHKYIKSGVYDVSLSITSKRDGQINTTVMNDLITIHPTPSADFEWDFVNGASEEPTVKVINTSDNASTYTWKFGDGTNSHEISPIKSYSEKGKQMIVLEVSNEFGCSDNKVKYIHINQEYNLMAPDGFSLKNGVFMPEGLKSGKNKFKLTVYNGEQPIYETTSKTKGWDGTLPSGVKAIAGDQYPWIVIIYNDNTNEEKYFSGILTILP